LTERNLNRLRAGIAAPAYDRHATDVGIVHFGPGAFHHGHQAWYVDALLPRDPRWGISEVELRAGVLAEAFAAQDCLYTVAELDEQIRFQVIGSVKEYIVTSENSRAAFSRLVMPSVRLVTMTVSEKGYCLDGSGALDLNHGDIKYDLAHPTSPTSVIGWITEGLVRRRAAGLAPFVVMSCDNMVANGDKLHAAVLKFAEARGDKDLAAWIAGEVRFPCTMVDSITPATDEALKQKVAEAIGLWDGAPVQREAFVQWVIEDILGPDAPDFASVGASLTRDVKAFEFAKLRLLNGAHSTLTYVGLLMGYSSVGETMKDARLAGFVGRMMREDIVPSLRQTRGLDFESYIADILQRFHNPALTHKLYQIASDGSQKLPYRILGTIADALDTGRPIDRLAVPIAAWMQFVAREAKAGRTFADPLSDTLVKIGQACVGKARQDLPRFLALTNVFTRGLANNQDFVATVGAAYDRYADGRLLPD
jgi:fructuronate reductase